MFWGPIKAFFETGLAGYRAYQDSQKTQLEIEKLKDDAERRKSPLIREVTTEEVQEFDPRQYHLRESIKKRPHQHECAAPQSSPKSHVGLYIAIIIIFVCIPLVLAAVNYLL